MFETDNVDWSGLIEQGVDMGLSLLTAVLILIIGFWLSGFVEQRLRKILAKSDKVDPTVAGFFASLAKYTVVAFTLIAVLDQFGVETTSLVALLGAAGLAVGLAMQGTLSNVAAGVMLLIFRPFRVGQVVDVAGHTGTVKAISLFVTALDTPDNVRITIPNGQIWGSPVKNFNHHETRRLDQRYGISYSSDIDKAMEIIHSVIGKDERVMADPEPLVAVIGLGDSSVDIVVRVWCNGADYWALNFALLKAVKEAFDAQGIVIPFPSRTIYQGTD